jgi:hypothetical protein
MAAIKKRYQTVIRTRKPKVVDQAKINATLREGAEIDRQLQEKLDELF